MKIFGWMADNAGCAWYRLMLPLGQLRQQGIEARWGNKLLEQDWDADVLIAQRTCLPGPTGIFQRLAKTKGKRPLLVFELDDDLLNVDRANKAASAIFNDPYMRANLIENMRVADLITVSTEPLAERVRQYNPNVAVLPNMVPADLLSWRPGCYVDRFTVGWQGSPTHDKDWATVAAPVERWFNKVKRAGLKVEMHTMGALPKSFPQIHPHRHTGWNPDIAQYYLHLDWHVALAPLAPTIFNNSKSDLRVLEAAMLGLPVVASNVMSYRESVQHGQTGFLASTAADWGKHLQVLAVDPELRTQIGENARQWAAKRTIEDNAYRWLEAYGVL